MRDPPNDTEGRHVHHQARHARHQPRLPLWGAEAMAPVINRTERDVYWLIKTGQIDVTKKGARYVTTRRRLLASLGVR